MGVEEDRGVEEGRVCEREEGKDQLTQFAVDDACTSVCVCARSVCYVTAPHHLPQT